MAKSNSVLMGILCSILFFVGCSGERTFDIKGVVAYGAEKIPEGTVTFENRNSMETYQVPLKSDGTYGLQLPGGEYRVFVEPLMVDESGVSDAGKTYKPMKSIPSEYRSSHTTPLSATISANQTLDFDLKK
jgi:hypothetical protein